MHDSILLWTRERRLGLLFVLVLAAVTGITLLAERAPRYAFLVGYIAVWSLALVTLIAIRRARNRKTRPTPIGRLSRDEKAKARSKLVKPKP